MQPKKKTVRQSTAAYEEIRQSIRTGRLLPGDVLSENSLSKQLAMSRTPVREAIQRLVHDGLLTVLPYRGTVVASPSISDIEEIYAIRELLEGLASRLATLRASAQELEFLAAISSSLASIAGSDHEHECVALDKDFHSEIARLSGNRRLERLLADLRDAELVPLRGEQMRERWKISVSEHEVILDAMKRRDAMEAEGAMRRHAQAAALFIARLAFGLDPNLYQDGGRHTSTNYVEHAS